MGVMYIIPKKMEREPFRFSRAQRVPVIGTREELVDGQLVTVKILAPGRAYGSSRFEDEDRDEFEGRAPWMGRKSKAAKASRKRS